MQTFKTSKDANDLDQLIDTIDEPVKIINSNGNTAILLSEKEWNNIQETLLIMEDEEMIDSIIEGGHMDIEQCVDESEIVW